MSKKAGKKRQRIEELEAERRALIEERAALIHNLTSAQSAIQVVGQELTKLQEEMGKRVRAQSERAAEVEKLEELIKHSLRIADADGTHEAITHLSTEFKARLARVQTETLASVPQRILHALNGGG